MLLRVDEALDGGRIIQWKNDEIRQIDVLVELDQKEDFYLRKMKKGNNKMVM